MVNPRLRNWLLDDGSLTRRIQSASPSFRVDFLFQHLQPAAHDESSIIGVRPRTLCMVREVSLVGAGMPLVFARTVAAPGTLRGPWRWLASLGTRPLGATLFADPHVRRSALRFRLLGPSHPLHRRAAALLDQAPPRLWARRSIFALHRSRLLVTEVFLPAMLGLNQVPCAST